MPELIWRLLRHPRVEPLVSVGLRARLLRAPGRFALRELGGRRTVGVYRLRGRGGSVVLEHGSPDVEAFDEIFYQGIYEPPPAAARALAGLERPRVLDIGANVGLFGAWVTGRWPEAEIDAYEPDPRNAAMLRRTVAANGAGERWRVHAVAAAAHARTLPFRIGRYAMSSRTSESDPDATRLEAVDVLPELATADLVKLDAEGAEWEILDDPRFATTSARVIALEYHPDHCPEADARAAAVDRLERAGFTVQEVATQAPPGYGSLWAWRA